MFQYKRLRVCKLLTRVAGFTGTFIAIDLVDAGPIVTWIAFAVVNVYFTVDSCRERSCFK